MINFSRYDIVIVRFPFASSLTYKARPAVIISSDFYNNSPRDTLFIMAISSQTTKKLDFEPQIKHWKESGLLKSSIFKSAIATIEKEYVITKLGKLNNNDIVSLENMIKILLCR